MTRTPSLNPHLLMLLTQDLHSPSGLGRYFPWAKYLVREGFRVTILAPHSNYEELDQSEMELEGVKIRYVSQMHVRKINNKTEYFSPLQLIKVSLEITRALYRAGLDEPADLILIGKPHPMNGIAGLRLARRLNLPLIVDCDDYEAESNHTSSAWQKLVLRHFENNLPKKADLVTTNTYFMKNHLVSHGVASEKVAYLPNGVDTERFQIPPAEQVLKLKETLGLAGKRVVGYFGSLNLVNHPVDLLLRSFRRVAEKIEDARLLIVGGGKDLESLKSLSDRLGLTDDTVFTGRVKPHEMNLFYALAEVSVDPVNDTLADRGRCPLKIFESWKMGVPVVSSNVGDRGILMGNEMSALLATAGDEEQLAAVLVELLSDHHQLQEHKKNVAQRSLQFDWAAIASQSKTIFADRFLTSKIPD